MTLELCKGLKRLGHDAMVACGEGPFVEMAMHAGIQHFLLPIGRKKYDPLGVLGCFASLIQIIRHKKIDILVTRHRRSIPIAHFATRVTSTPHIYTIVNVFHSKLWLPWTGDFTIAISQACLDNAVNILKASPDHCKLIYSGLSVPQEVMDRGKSRSRLSISNEAHVIGIVARLDAWKGHRFLLKAMTIVRKWFDNAILLVVGDGEERANLESQRTALELPKTSVIFLGERRDVWDILPALDVCALPSVDSEGLGRALLEAAACGIPLVGSAVGGIPEIIEDGWNGILVPPEDLAALSDALIRILSNSRLAREMGVRARQTVSEKFSSEQEIVQNAKVLEDVLARRLSSVRKTDF